MGIFDKLFKAGNDDVTNTDMVKEVGDISEAKKELEQTNKITEIKHEQSRTKQIFKIEKNRVDYETLNLLLKVGGALLLLILLLVVFILIRDTFLSPFFNLLKIISPFILGIVFAWLLNPLVTRVEKDGNKRRMSRGASSALVTMLILILVTLAVALLVYVTFNQVLGFLTGGKTIMDFASGGEDIIDAIENNLNNPAEPHTGLYKLIMNFAMLIGLISMETIVDANGVTQTWYTISSDIFGQVDFGSIASSGWKFFYTFLIAMIVAMYTLPSFSNLGYSFKSILPRKYKKTGGELIDIVGHSFTSYMRGALKIALTVGSTISILLLLITFVSNFIIPSEGLYDFDPTKPSTFVGVLLTILSFGVILSLTNLIPYLGPFIGGTPVVLLTALADQSALYWVTWATLGSIILIQSLESLILQPLVMGRQTKMHPVVILLGLTVFGALFGIVGMLIATPIVAIFRGIVEYFDKKYGIF